MNFFLKKIAAEILWLNANWETAIWKQTIENDPSVPWRHSQVQAASSLLLQLPFGNQDEI